MPRPQVETGMSGQKPEISIIIRTKNEERFIHHTLSAIFDQDIDLPLEVIVIDSGSKDRTLDIVRKHTVRLCEIDSCSFTYGRALNLGASMAEGRYLINLSAHCIPTNRRWIASIVSALRADSEIAATYGAQIPIKGLNPFEERALTAAFALDDNGNIGPPFSNANCAVRKEVWERQPFDEKATFAEDFIWSQILPRQYKIKYVPEAAVYHSHPLRLSYWAKRSYDNGVFVQYLENVYGLEYRWAVSRDSIAGRRHRKGVLSTVSRHAARSLNMLRFLIENNYFKFIPVFPIYWALEQYCYRRGLADGFKLYGGFKKTIT